MQTVAAVNFGAIEKNKGPAAQAGTGLTKLSDQQQTKIGDPSFPNLLTQEQQKESEKGILYDLSDVGTKKEEQAEEQAMDGFSISGFIIPLLTPENLQGTVEKAPADLIAVDTVSSAELPPSEAPAQQTELKANFTNTADVISPEPLKGEAESKADNKADNIAAMKSIQAESENSGEKLQMGFFLSDPNNAANSAVPQNETIPVVLSSGNIKETNGQKESNTFQTEQEGQPKLTVNVTKEVIKNLSAMSEENTSGTGTGSEDSQGARLEENKAENADLHGSGEISTEFIMGSDAAKTSETNEVSRAVEKALNRFVEDLRETKTVGPEIKIVLEPESLGTLTISVSHSESGIAAKIRTEDKNVCAMISNELSKLIRSMEAKGITVDHVDVFSGGAEQGFNFSQNNHSGRGGQHLAYKVRAVESTDTSPRSYFSNFWQKVTAGEASDGTVEYRV